MGEAELVAESEVYGVCAGVRWVCDAVMADVTQVLEQTVAFCYKEDGFCGVVRLGTGVFWFWWEEDSPPDEHLAEERESNAGPEVLSGAKRTW